MGGALLWLHSRQRLSEAHAHHAGLPLQSHVSLREPPLPPSYPLPSATPRQPFPDPPTTLPLPRPVSSASLSTQTSRALLRTLHFPSLPLSQARSSLDSPTPATNSAQSSASVRTRSAFLSLPSPSSARSSESAKLGIHRPPPVLSLSVPDFHGPSRAFDFPHPDSTTRQHLLSSPSSSPLC